MKNLKIRKKLMLLGMLNTFILSGIPNNTSYAFEKETVDVTEFNDIRDVVVAKESEVAIKDTPLSNSNLIGVLEPGEHLKLISDVENYYEVLYRGQLAYVNKSYVYVSTLDEININKSINAKDIVVAKELVEIKSLPTEESETLGTLKEKESLKVDGKQDGYYQVIYKDNVAYVSDNKVEYHKIFAKSGYASRICGLYETTALDNKISDIDELEFVKIYNETDNAYYTEINGNSGYIAKESVMLLDDIYIVTDISDQIVEMYDNNDLMLSTSVVTGKKNNHPTPTGIYYIGDEDGEISDHCDLVGVDKNNNIIYRSRVTYMMRFIKSRGIGFHDSEYGVDDRGVHHGWRTYDEFGGNTYINNGSHACVNMPNDATKIMYDIIYPYVVEQGNLVKVLVKE